MSKRVVFVLLSVVAIMCFLMIKKTINQNRNEHLHLNKLKNIDLIYIDGSFYNIEDTASSILIFYKTNCYHCQDYLRKIEEQIKSFHTTQVVFISTDNPILIKKFIDTYTHNDFDFIHDKSNELHKELNVKVFPTTFIVRDDLEIKKRYEGAYAIQKVISALPPD